MTNVHTSNPAHWEQKGPHALALYRQEGPKRTRRTLHFFPVNEEARVTIHVRDYHQDISITKGYTWDVDDQGHGTLAVTCLQPTRMHKPYTIVISSPWIIHAHFQLFILSKRKKIRGQTWPLLPTVTLPVDPHTLLLTEPIAQGDIGYDDTYAEHDEDDHVGAMLVPERPSREGGGTNPPEGSPLGGNGPPPWTVPAGNGPPRVSPAWTTPAHVSPGGLSPPGDDTQMTTHKPRCTPEEMQLFLDHLREVL